MRAIVAALAMLLDAVVAGADPQWVRTLGVDDGFCELGVSSVEQTADGGYVLAGWVEGCPTVDRDAWIAKLDTNGTLLWQKSYGGNADDEATVVRRTTDGGFLLAGVTKSFADPDGDFWCVRLDANGKVKWQKSYGGKNEEWLYWAEQTSDGGFAFVGWSDTAEATGMDAWLAKISSSGTLEWVKSYDGGTDHDDGFYALRPADDGGFILAGVSPSFTGGDDQGLAIRTSASGTISSCTKLAKGFSRRPATPVTAIWDTAFVTALVKPTVKGTKAKTATATAVTATPCK